MDAFQRGQVGGDPASEGDAETSKRAGNKAFGQQAYAAAAAHYSCAISIGGDDAKLRSNRSGAFLGMKEADLAVEDAQRCVQLDSSWGKGYSRLGAALLERGDWEAALAAYEDGLEVEPGNLALQEGVKKAAARSS